MYSSHLQQSQMSTKTMSDSQTIYVYIMHVYKRIKTFLIIAVFSMSCRVLQCQTLARYTPQQLVKGVEANPPP